MGDFTHALGERLGATPETAKALTKAAQAGERKSELYEDDDLRRGKFVVIEPEAVGRAVPKLRIDG